MRFSFLCVLFLSACSQLPYSKNKVIDEKNQQRAVEIQASIHVLLENLPAALVPYRDGEINEGLEMLQLNKVKMQSLVDECLELAACDRLELIKMQADFSSVYNSALQLLHQIIADLQTESEEIDEPGSIPFTGEALIDADQEASSFLLNGTDVHEMIELNSLVKASIDDWLTWMRPKLMRSHEYYQFLRPKIAPIYEEAGLPEALLFAMIATESGGKVHSHSRAGAAGLLQFMRYTGRKYGLKAKGTFDMRLDPVAATRANVAYLQDRLKTLDNSLEKALAAYNGGENRMKRLHKKFAGKSFWDSRIFYAFPKETRDYVPRVLAAAWLFLKAEDYNLQFPVYDNRTTQLELKQSISLSELTICLGQDDNIDGWFRTLRNLNPAQKPAERFKAGDTIELPLHLESVYQNSCMDGQLLETASQLFDANYPGESLMEPYIVRKGDTVGRIAANYRCVSTRELAVINKIKSPRYLIRVGQMLQVPKCK